jgi:hypothetical protein
MIGVIGIHLRTVDSPADHEPIGFIHGLFCGALAMTYILMGVLGALHTDTDFTNPATRKLAWRRVGSRIIIGMCFMIMGLVGRKQSLFMGSVVDLIIASVFCSIAMLLEEYGHLRAALLNLVHL